MERIVFLHGLGGNKKLFNKYVEFFSLKYLVESYDLLGHGSAPPVAPNQFREENAKYLQALLSQNKDIETTIISHSISGEIAHLLSISPKFNLRKIIFLDSSCPTKTVVESWKSLARRIQLSKSPQSIIQETYISLLGNNISKENQDIVLSQLSTIDPIWVSDVLASTKILTEINSKIEKSIIEGYETFPNELDYSWKSLYPEATYKKVKLNGHYYFLENINETIKVIIDLL